MRKVIVESPFNAPTEEGIEHNLAYLRAAMNDCFKRGEAPYASHGLYTQKGVLNDRIPEERKLGMEAGFLWGETAELTVLYVDLGMSSGMVEGVRRAEAAGRPVERRSLPGWTAYKPKAAAPSIDSTVLKILKIFGFAKTANA